MATTTSLIRFSPLTRPPSTVHLTLRPAPTARIRTRVLPIRSSLTVSSTDRLVSILAYTLPLFNSIHYGRFLLSRSTVTASIISPILPFVAAYRSLPFASFIGFFALYVVVARNPNLSRYVRFNAMQAVVLDVILALPVLVQRVLGTPSGRVGYRVLENGYGAMFVISAVCFAYSVLCCVFGRTPFLPLVSSTADQQLRD